MANMHTHGSAILVIPEEKRLRALEILREMEAARENSPDEDRELSYEMQPEGLWLTHDESISPGLVEQVVGRLQDELELDEPFHMEFANVCDRPIVGAFGGCAIRVRRGQETRWCHTSDITREPPRVHLFQLILDEAPFGLLRVTFPADAGQHAAWSIDERVQVGWNTYRSECEGRGTDPDMDEFATFLQQREPWVEAARVYVTEIS